MPVNVAAELVVLGDESDFLLIAYWLPAVQSVFACMQEETAKVHEV